MSLDDQNFKLSQSDISDTLTTLDLAIENHRNWFDTLHRSIIFKQDFPADILDELAHTKCQFGKWYYGAPSELFKQYDEFRLLEETHRCMHYNARLLSHAFINDETPSVDTYNKFISNQKELIGLLQSLHDKLINLSHGYDSLTGLLNRRFITLMLDNLHEKAIRYKNMYTVAMVDADHFKQVNDTYGHAVGDVVLKKIADLLCDNLRKSDNVGRIGGEEFLVILPETDKNEALKVLEKIRETISKTPIETGEELINVTISIGISQVSHDDEDSWQVVKRADFSLYRSKENGRNQVTVSG